MSGPSGLLCLLVTQPPSGYTPTRSLPISPSMGTNSVDSPPERSWWSHNRWCLSHKGTSLYSSELCFYPLLPTSACLMEKAREFQKSIYFCFIEYAKAFDCVDHNKPWKILKEMGIPDHLICLLRNLYAGQEATVRTGHGTTDWFQIGKGVR